MYWTELKPNQQCVGINRGDLWKVIRSWGWSPHKQGRYLHARLFSLARLCNPMGCSSSGSSIHGIFQARLLEWVATSSSRGSSWLKDGTCVSCISCTGRLIVYHDATWEAHLFQLIRHNEVPAMCWTGQLLSCALGIIKLSKLYIWHVCNRIFFKTIV